MKALKYENKLNEILNVLNNLELNIDKLELLKHDIKEIDKYYQSKSFIKDYKEYEKGNINKTISILGEDTLWNMFLKITELNEQLNDITSYINKN